MTRSLHKARIHPTLIQRLSKLMVKENLDEQLMESLDYATISNALKTAGVSSWGSRRQIFQCFNSGTLARRKTLSLKLASSIFGGLLGNVNTIGEMEAKQTPFRLVSVGYGNPTWINLRMVITSSTNKSCQRRCHG